jgi:hypothetical protein
MEKHRRGADFLCDMGLELFSSVSRKRGLVTKKLNDIPSRGIYTAFGNFKVSTFEATYPIQMGYVASKVAIS